MLYLMTTIFGTTTLFLMGNVIIVYRQNKRYQKLDNIKKQNCNNDIVNEAVRQIKLEYKNLDTDLATSYRRGKELGKAVNKRIEELKRKGGV